MAELEVVNPAAGIPEKLPSLAKVLVEAQKAGLGINVMTYENTIKNLRKMVKKRHDIRAALRTLELTIRSLDEGYKFDDNLAEQKTASIRRAVGVMSREVNVLLQLLNVEP